MNVRMNTKRLAIAIAGVLMVVAGCSSSKSSTAGSSSTPGGGSAGGTKTLTVGLFTDLTGPAASGNKTSVQGVQAGVASLAAKAGYTIKYVTVDTATSPATALTAAQQLVEQDHVFAVIADSSLLFAGASYLTSQGIPVVGVAEDGPEWITAKNMFSVYGPTDLTKVTSTIGAFFKKEGGTVLGSLGYGISPSSAASAKDSAASAQAAGLNVGYLNANFPFGSTNVAPIALAMKSAGVDTMTASVDPNTGFALITALRQAGVNLKVALLPTGYGGDLLQAGPGAVQAAQNVYFLSSYEPIEMQTAATNRFKSALRSVGITTDPTYAEYAGYSSVALLIDGLKAAGPNPTRAGLITALSGITDFNADGLFGSHKLDLSNRTNSAVGVDNCYWITKLHGSTFDLVPGADPICGTVVSTRTG
ncbi:MAG TPA: ABC transporter substrate-binding protein [Acidimicrobiales bacterium]